MNKTRSCDTRLIRSSLLVLPLVMAPLGAAQAVSLASSGDWNIDWINTPQYNLGVRIQPIDNSIGNNPLYSQSDYKFSHSGDIVTDRFSDLTEFDAQYKDNLSFRLSASAWKDFAYDSSQVKNHPGDVAPGTPYTSLNSYRNNSYSGYVKKYYDEGAQLLDAFGSYNFKLLGNSSNIKVGRLSQYWGTSVFFGNEGVAFAQQPTDVISALSHPGTTAKQLALPRTQVLFSQQLGSDLSFAAQYFMEWRPSRFPEGGTYLTVAPDFYWNGPDYLEGAVPHGSNREPKHWFNGNFGAKLKWSPDFLPAGGTLGFYARRFNGVNPWVMMGVDPKSGKPNYHLSYAKGVQLYGLSYSGLLGANSIGIEASYLRNTGLNNGGNYGPAPDDTSGTSGPTGDLVNVVANITRGLTPSPFYDTGIVLGEITGTHLVSVKNHESLYNGVDTSGCPSHDKFDSCSTDNSAAVAVLFDPQWLQVFPGVNIDMPIFGEYGLYGNSPQLDTYFQGGLTYTAGLHAEIYNQYNVTLQYNGYHWHQNGGQTSEAPGYPAYAASGNGEPVLNDKGWISLTLKTSF